MKLWTLGVSVLCGSVVLGGCLRGSSGGGNIELPQLDGGTVADAGNDAGSLDAGGPDGGPDAGSVDAGSADAGADAGLLDGGPDGGSADAGTPDGGTDGGTSTGGFTFGSPGPWPLTNQTYGQANGILEAPVVGTTTDEAQNLWVATNSALYLLRAGETTFRRFDAKDGLHLQSNAARYCDDWAPNHECPIYGAAADPGISEITGGAPGEVFVGYTGYHDYAAAFDATNTDPYRHSGMLDRVRLSSNGSLEVVRFDMVSGNSTSFWHNRTIERMVYDHFIHKHELYVGTDHGVDKFSPDLWHATIPGTWFNGVQNNLMWMSDHLHPQACYHHPCDSSESDLRLGDWRGLALAPNGDLWVAGKWAAGLITWVADNPVWFNRGGNSYALAFGDPYTGNCNGNRPVFCTPAEGDDVDMTAVTVGKDGRVWFATTPYSGEPAYGIAAWDGHQFTYFDPMRQAGLAETSVRDLVALPDGRLAVAGQSTGLVIWDPRTGASKAIRAGGGIPDDHVIRLELDTMVNPPALHVSTYGGAAVLRVLP